MERAMLMEVANVIIPVRYAKVLVKHPAEVCLPGRRAVDMVVMVLCAIILMPPA
jgi:hypothetical protein